MERLTIAKPLAVSIKAVRIAQWLYEARAAYVDSDMAWAELTPEQQEKTRAEVEKLIIEPPKELER